MPSRITENRTDTRDDRCMQDERLGMPVRGQACAEVFPVAHLGSILEISLFI